MVTKAHSAAGRTVHHLQPPSRRDSLLSLAEDANHAGLLMTANRLLDLATSVLGEPPRPRPSPVSEHGIDRPDIDPEILELKCSDAG